jgi:hypothetical protein
MFDWLNAQTLATLSLAAMFGGMLFFSAVVAPMVFVKLPGEHAGRFIRQLFPWYYLVNGALALLGVLFLAVSAARSTLDLVLALSIVAGFVYARQLLMPRINALRDAALAGDEQAGVAFERRHRLSVVINAVQLILALALLVRLIG